MKLIIKSLKLYLLYLITTGVVFAISKLLVSEQAQKSIQNIITEKTPFVSVNETSPIVFVKVFLITFFIHLAIVIIGKLIRIPKVKINQILFILLSIVVGLAAGSNAFGGGITSYAWQGWKAVLLVGQIEWFGAALFNTAASKLSLTTFVGPFFMKPKFILTIVGVILILISAVNQTVIWNGAVK